MPWLPPDDAVGQQVAQGSVDPGVRLAEDAHQLRRIDEGPPAEGIEQLSFGNRHVLSMTRSGAVCNRHMGVPGPSRMGRKSPGIVGHLSSPLGAPVSS